MNQEEVVNFESCFTEEFDNLWEKVTKTENEQDKNLKELQILLKDTIDENKIQSAKDNIDLALDPEFSDPEIQAELRDEVRFLILKATFFNRVDEANGTIDPAAIMPGVFKDLNELIFNDCESQKWKTDFDKDNNIIKLTRTAEKNTEIIIFPNRIVEIKLKDEEIKGEIDIVISYLAEKGYGVCCLDKIFYPPKTDKLISYPVE